MSLKIHKRIEIEISRLSRGDRISNVARNELNMVPANLKQL